MYFLFAPTSPGKQLLPLSSSLHAGVSQLACQGNSGTFGAPGAIGGASAGGEANNLVRMRNQALGQSAPSLTGLVSIKEKKCPYVERESTKQITLTVIYTQIKSWRSNQEIIVILPNVLCAILDISQAQYCFFRLLSDYITCKIIGQMVHIYRVLQLACNVQPYGWGVKTRFLNVFVVLGKWM